MIKCLISYFINISYWDRSACQNTFRGLLNILSRYPDHPQVLELTYYAVSKMDLEKDENGILVEDAVKCLGLKNHEIISFISSEAIFKVIWTLSWVSWDTYSPSNLALLLSTICETW